MPTDYPDGPANSGGSRSRRSSLAQTRSSFAGTASSGACRPTAARQDPRFEEIYWWLRVIDEATQRRVVRVLAERHEVDMERMPRNQMMDWDEIRTLAADPLVTIGAHTKGITPSPNSRQRAPLTKWLAAPTASSKSSASRPVSLRFPYGDPASAGPADFALAREPGSRPQ